jgi:hypothetical protein
MTAGMASTTPAAVVERGTLTGQRQVFAPLAGLAQAAREAGIQPPALFVIGPTVGRASHLEWLSSLPLARERIVMVGLDGESGTPDRDLGAALALAGADVVSLPLPLTPVARIVMAAAPVTACILRTVAEVDLLDEERDGPEWEGKVVSWCLGEEVASRALRRGWQRVRTLREGSRQAEIVGLLAGANREPVA